MESYRCSYSSAGHTAGQNAERAEEYLPDVRAAEEPEPGTHSSDKTNPTGTSAAQPSPPDPDSSRQSSERRFEACVSCPSARTPAPAKPATAWAVAPAESHQSR